MTVTACQCGDCSACVQQVLDAARGALEGAERRLSGVYGVDVGLRVRPRREGARGGRVEAQPALPKRPPSHAPGPQLDIRHERALALAGAEDIEQALSLCRAHAEAERRALADELADLARRSACAVEQSTTGARSRLRIRTPSGARLDVRCDGPRYDIGGRSHQLSGPEALRSALVAELALDGRLATERKTSSFVLGLLAGERPRFASEAELALVDRLGLLEPEPPAAWLRGEIRAFFDRGPCPGGLGSPVAVGGVAYRGGRLLAIDGVPLRHVDVDALARWRLWATERARARERPLTWRPVTWGVAVHPGDRLPHARDGPVSADVVFDRHRRMYARASEPGPAGRRLIDWGRREVALPIEPPPRSRGPARAHYESIARHWLVGWSLTELAEGSGASRSAVDRLIRSARTLAADPSYAGRWLAIDFDRVVVTDRPGGAACSS